MAIIVFRSSKARYRVWFPPERYGMMDTEVYERDRNNNILVDAETKSPIKQRRAHPHAQFDMGMLALDDKDPIQAQMIDNLRRTIVDGHIAGRLADDDLYEESQELTADINAGEGAIVVTVPGELSADDRALLFGTDKGPGLMTYFHNAIPAPAAKGAFALLDAALKRYEVRGILSPTKERAKKQLRPRIIELVYALKDAGMPLDTEDAQASRKSRTAAAPAAPADPPADAPPAGAVAPAAPPDTGAAAGADGNW